jgi:hypothetical protein
MLERMTERSTVAADAISHDPDLDLRAAVDRSVRQFAEVTGGERALLRAFMIRGALDPSIAGPGSEGSQAAGRTFKAAVLAHRDEIGHPDPEIAADIAYRMVYDVLTRHVMYGPTFESDSERTWDELVEELISASVAYLRFGER